MKVKRKKTPKVNTYSVELYLERTIEQAMQVECIRKPVSWALYQAWKWADANEKERKNDKGRSNKEIKRSKTVVLPLDRHKVRVRDE